VEVIDPFRRYCFPEEIDIDLIGVEEVGYQQFRSNPGCQVGDSLHQPIVVVISIVEEFVCNPGEGSILVHNIYCFFSLHNTL